MSRTVLSFIFWCLLLVPAQAIVFNHICIADVAVPFVFIYMILRLPVTLSQNWILTIAFAMGLAVDIFSDTQGMNALACTLIAGMRPQVIRLYFPREEDMSYPQPLIHAFGAGIYMKYAVTMVLLFCTAIFLVEFFTFFNPLRLVLSIVCSTLFTTAIMIGIDSLTTPSQEGRT